MMSLDSYEKTLPRTGIGEQAAYDLLEQMIEDQSAKLGSKYALAHMDPPTPDIAANLVGLNARFNQNLLHPDLSPLATAIERHVINWLAPLYGMADGHMCSGSTIANLTALWCARESGAKRVLASSEAHLSIAKAAHLLAMDYEAIEVDEKGKIDIGRTDDLGSTCLVLTAGTTGRGVVDPLGKTDARWTHVDAAWSGPLIMTKHSDILNGISDANSISISAHKWFYQPKDSALVLFADAEAQKLVSFHGDYLAVPNVGIQGSRGGSAIPLFATLLAWGKDGMAQRIEKNMADAQKLSAYLRDHSMAELKQMPETAVINWRPRVGTVENMLHKLGESVSSTRIDGQLWLRHVAANPNAEIDAIIRRIDQILNDD